MSDSADDTLDAQSEEPVCGSTQTLSGIECYCPVANPDDRCFVHAGDDDDVTTNLPAAVIRRLNLFADSQPIDRALYEDYYVEYQEKAENDIEAARLAGLAVLCDRLEATLIREGPTADNPETNHPRPRQQLLRAYTDLLREHRLKLNHEGVSNTDDSGALHDGISALWEGSEEAEETDDHWS